MYNTAVNKNNTILTVKNLKVTFQLEKQKIFAVDDISFNLLEKEILGIVGESGSGKSVSTLALLSLLPSYARVSTSTLRYKNSDITKFSQAQLKDIRGKEIAYIPQEPSRSYDPLFTIRSTFAETLRVHNPTISKTEIEAIAVQTLIDVSIDDARQRLDSFFHQFSGGMIQRVMIALALCMNPSIIIADEPTTALDVLVQKKVVDLLTSLTKKYKHALIFITHDISLVSQFADRLLVMKNGKIVEQGDIKNILQNPQHKYTQQLLSSIITLDTDPIYKNTKKGTNTA